MGPENFGRALSLVRLPPPFCSPPPPQKTMAQRGSTSPREPVSLSWPLSDSGVDSCWTLGGAVPTLSGFWSRRFTRALCVAGGMSCHVLFPILDAQSLAISHNSNMFRDVFRTFRFTFLRKGRTVYEQSRSSLAIFRASPASIWGHSSQILVLPKNTEKHGKKNTKMPNRTVFAPHKEELGP